MSLSATGEEPTVRSFSHVSSVDYYITPGDEDSAIATIHGNGFRILLPGAGGLLHIAGFDQIDGPFHGVARGLIVNEATRVVEDPVADAALCEELGASPE